MSEFATPTSTPSGFNQVGSPDALTGQSGMVSGLEAAAEAWDATAATLENVAHALSTDSRTLARSWQGAAAESSLRSLDKTIASANSGVTTFRSYAHNLRVLAAYIKKIRSIKAMLRNIWKLILISVFVGLAALALGVVAAEFLAPLLPSIGEFLGGLASSVGDLLGLGGDASAGVAELPEVAPEVMAAPEVSEDVAGTTAPVEPALTVDPGSADPVPTSGQVGPAPGEPEPTSTLDPVSGDSPPTSPQVGPAPELPRPTPSDTPTTSIRPTSDNVPRVDEPKVEGHEGPLATTVNELTTDRKSVV